MVKLTRQGVRDLDDIPSKPKGVKLDKPPVKLVAFCKHVRTKSLDSGDTLCLDCDTLWDWDGDPY